MIIKKDNLTQQEIDRIVKREFEPVIYELKEREYGRENNGKIYRRVQ